jgi:hypothetical protein
MKNIYEVQERTIRQNVLAMYKYFSILHYFCDRVKYGRENMSPVHVDSSPSLPPLKQPPPYTGTRTPVAGV